jgi:hypothetical protein
MELKTPQSHAWTEDEVLYQASILIGEYLKLKLSQKTGR